MSQTLGDEFPKELERTQQKLKIYEMLPPASGFFAVGMIKATIKMAEQAMAEQDAVAMIRLYKEMQDISV